MNSRKRILIAVWLFVAVFLIGVVGFKVLGGREWSFLDAVYMTVITVATIGYGEVHDLAANPAARVFGAFYIILSLGTIAFAVTSITAFVVEGELKKIWGRRKMDKDISRLKDHVIVCGSDETAETIVRELLATKRDFVLIDPALDRIEKIVPGGGLLYIQGDPAEDDVLIRAGIERAQGIILSLPTDEANLFVTVTARSLNPKIRIVAKGIDLKSHGKMKKAGADYVVSPTYIGGMRMVSQMVRPAVVTFLDQMLYGKEQVLRVEDVLVKAGSKAAGKTVGESGARDVAGALLVGIKKPGEKDYIFNPAGDVVIGAGDYLIYIATPESLKNLRGIAE